MFIFFNCLMSNINLVFFNCLMSSFCSPKIISFAIRREQLFMDARPNFRKNDNLLSWRHKWIFEVQTLCTSILKCRFLTKGMKLTSFILFKVLGVPQIRGTSVYIISIGTALKFAEHKWSYVQSILLRSSINSFSVRLFFCNFT